MTSKRNLKQKIIMTEGLIKTSLLLLIIASALLFFVSTYYIITQDQDLDTNISEYPLIDKIAEDCGSTYLTKRFGEDRWSVFKNTCLAEGYCKYDYVPLEECLK